MKKMLLTVAAALLPFMQAFAAEGHGINGSELNLLWAIPFAGILLSIALFPLFAPDFWHHHFGKVSAFWAALLLVPMIINFGFSVAFYEVSHVYLLEYFPFIILLLALFTIAGGVRLKGDMVGSPKLNTLILLIGTLLASWMGTTGAAMLLIRPLIRANSWRKNKVHIIIFFIFLVANIGGSLTPLGDPPLFLGFLQGVHFFWTTSHLLVEMSFLVICLLVIFFIMDSYFYKKEENTPPSTENGEKLGIDGGHNLFLLLGVIGSVLFSGFVHLGEVHFGSIHLPIQNILRDIFLLVLTFISIKTTSKASREANGFDWFPIMEVGKLFAGIFVTIIPAIAILKVGKDGALGAIVNLVTNADGTANNDMYFWVTGLLSSFLDNAPTYLVFFNTAGGAINVEHLMTDMSHTLMAISSGAVFMGAMTYIGNAPNFMVKSIAETSDIKMPSFLGYMGWSVAILIPLFFLVTIIFI
ncbi:sodium:proton antiporter [bacterium]|nr:MAG: sodium:proton antiporter [bacterium]